MSLFLRFVLFTALFCLLDDAIASAGAGAKVEVKANAEKKVIPRSNDLRIKHVFPLPAGKEAWDKFPTMGGIARELKIDAPLFFEMGGNEGRIYLVDDPGPEKEEDSGEGIFGNAAGSGSQLEDPFLLSDEAKDPNTGNVITMTYEELKGSEGKPGFCASKNGSDSLSIVQLKALTRALTYDRVFDPGIIHGLADSFIMSISVDLLSPDNVFLLNGSMGYLVRGHTSVSATIRCVRKLNEFPQYQSLLDRRRDMKTIKDNAQFSYMEKY